MRYGVAPDHEKMKSVAGALRKVLEHERVRFLGNVELGADVSLADLHRHYDAIVVANGAAVDRRLGIGGEELPGSFSATEFVSWYSGHPDAALDKFTLTAETVIVIGVGNVAVDVARVLSKTADELRTTDIPDHVLAVLSHSQVRDVMIIGRVARPRPNSPRRSFASWASSPTPTSLCTRRACARRGRRGRAGQEHGGPPEPGGAPGLVRADAAGPAEAVAPALSASPGRHLRRCVRHRDGVRAWQT